MKKLIALLVCVVFTLIVADQAMAQAKQPGTDLNRLSGRVHMIKKDANEFQIRVGNAFRTIVYDDSTAFSFRNQKSDINSLKEGVRVICLGKFDDKNRLKATRVDIREEARK
jgi:hypothetical protein